jgi:hypothetical protein
VLIVVSNICSHCSVLFIILGFLRVWNYSWVLDLKYGKGVQFRSFWTKHALMCEIHEQSKLSILKCVLCSLNKYVRFFYLEMFNTVII